MTNWSVRERKHANQTHEDGTAMIVKRWRGEIAFFNSSQFQLLTPATQTYWLQMRVTIIKMFCNCHLKLLTKKIRKVYKPYHWRWLDFSQWMHGRWRWWRVVGPWIHSVPGTVQQLVHLAVGQRRQREGPVQLLHVQLSPEQKDAFLFALWPCSVMFPFLAW